MEHQIKSLLLEPAGRIERGPYWLGVVVLIVSSFVVGLLPVVGSWLALLLLWPWFCILSKRCRDAGRDTRLAAVAVALLGVSSVLAALMSLVVMTPGAALGLLPFAGLLGVVALLSGLGGLAAVIWFGVAPSRPVLDC